MVFVAHLRNIMVIFSSDNDSRRIAFRYFHQLCEEQDLFIIVYIMCL
jgi:hypothetical protein